MQNAAKNPLPKLLTAALLAAVFFAPPAAAFTDTLSYQGKLSQSGSPVNATKDMQFVLFNAATGGSALFTETLCTVGGDGPGVNVISGRYDVEIGSHVAGGIPEELFRDNAAVWLEVRVDNDDNCAAFENISPRIRMQAAAYAFEAVHASTASRLEAVDSVAIQPNGGKVGVGTSNPSTLLHVSSPNASGSDELFRISSGTAANQEVFRVLGNGQFYMNEVFQSGGRGVLFIHPQSPAGAEGGEIQLAPAKAGQTGYILDVINANVRLFHDGFVPFQMDGGGQAVFGGLGAVPTARLAVSSANATSSDTILLVSSGTGTGQALFTVKGDGKVGIGTDAPTQPFQVNPILGEHRHVIINQFGQVDAHFQNNAMSYPFIGTNRFSGAGYGAGILFRLGDGTTPVEAGAVEVGQEQAFTGVAGTRDAYMAFTTAVDGVVTEKMRIESGGNVGVGTDDPWELIHVEGGDRPSIALNHTGVSPLRLYQAVSDSTRMDLSSNVKYDGAAYKRDDPTKFASMYAQAAGGHYFSSIDSGALDPTPPASIANTMTMTPDARVGVGTTAPTARLHVSSVPAAAADDLFKVTTGAVAGSDPLIVKGNGDIDVGGGKVLMGLRYSRYVPGVLTTTCRVACDLPNEEVLGGGCFGNGNAVVTSFATTENTDATVAGTFAPDHATTARSYTCVFNASSSLTECQAICARMGN